MPATPAIKNVTELLETVRPAYRRAFELASLGEQLTWDITWAVLPTPQGPIIAILCYVHVPALHQLGSFLQRTFPITIGSSSDVIKHLVAEQVRILKSDQEKALQENNGQVPSKPEIILP